jgi:hypothetical protein
MTDIIQEAVEGWADETERTATGEVQGHSVRLEKKEYEVEQLGPTDEKDLDAGEAQQLFTELVNRYGLKEQS